MFATTKSKEPFTNESVSLLRTCVPAQPCCFQFSAHGRSTRHFIGGFHRQPALQRHGVPPITLQHSGPSRRIIGKLSCWEPTVPCVEVEVLVQHLLLIGLLARRGIFSRYAVESLPPVAGAVAFAAHRLQRV